MVKARNLIRQDPLYATKVLVPCSWHATDLVAPLEVKSIKAAIKDAKQVTVFFKYRHRSKGVLRLKRENCNRDRRAVDGNNAKLIPTLEVNLMLKVLLLVVCWGVDDVIIWRFNGRILITCNSVCLVDA